MPRPAGARSQPASARRSASTPALAASGVAEIVDENMANAARVHAVERGADVAELHADRVRRRRAAARRAARARSSASPRSSCRPTPASARPSGSYGRPWPIRSCARRRYACALRCGRRQRPARGARARRATWSARGGAGRPPLSSAGSPICATSARATRSRPPLPVRSLATRIARACARPFETPTAALRPSIPDLDVEFLTWSVTVSAPADGRPPSRARPRPRADAPPSARALDPASARCSSSAVYQRRDLAPGYGSTARR